MENIAPMFRSWITTFAGVVAMLAIITPEVQTLFDEDPDTNPDVKVILTAMGVGGVGIAARDGNKSSEQVGASSK